MKVVVTGATGHLGTYVVPALASGGHDVLAVSRSGAPPRLPGVHASVTAVRTLAVDIRFDEAVAPLETELGAEVALVHLAAWRPRDTEAIGKAARRELLAVNVCGTMRVLDAARRAGGARVVVFPSTRADPLKDYAVSKLAGEDHVVSFGAEEGVRIAVLRLPALIHPPDAARAVQRAITEEICGIFDVTVEGNVPLFNPASQ